jgi:hypothetical protein
MNTITDLTKVLARASLLVLLAVDVVLSILNVFKLLYFINSDIVVRVQMA